MSISESQPRLAVRNIEDLVGLVPYLIGFHPQESLVVIVVVAGRVEVTARIDLAAVSDGDGLSTLLKRLFGRYPRAAGWFLAYTDDDVLAWEVLAGCSWLMGADRLQRLLQVGTTHWRADAFDGPTGEITGEVTSVAAEASLLGLPARPSRRELAGMVAGAPPVEAAELLDRFDSASVDLERVGARGRRRLLRRLLGSQRAPGVDDCIRLALLAERAEGMVTVLRNLSHENAEAQLELWSRVLRHSPVGHQPAVLGLVGMAAWQNGDGALQMVCLERLDRLDPMAPIGGLLEWLNTEVVPPFAWEDLREPLLGALADHFTVAGQPASQPGR